MKPLQDRKRFGGRWALCANPGLRDGLEPFGSGERFAGRDSGNPSLGKHSARTGVPFGEAEGPQVQSERARASLSRWDSRMKFNKLRLSRSHQKCSESL